ncbi:hypothetical protein ACHAQJ_007827 [Trichoderma viride]
MVKIKPYLRRVSHSPFGDNTVISQGDASLRAPHRPARSGVHVIPYLRNEDVVCRSDIIRELDALLPHTEGYRSAALWGLGGSGKTQIALEYSYRRCSEVACSVFWVRADSEATFLHDYKFIAKELGVSESLSDENLLLAVSKRIEAEPQWLLVVDNADNLELFGVGRTSPQPRSLRDFIPRGSGGTGSVLWTSRDKRILGTIVCSSRGIEVARMTLVETKTFFTAKKGIKTRDEDKDTNALLEELQCHPLAISQARAYMRRVSTPIHEYLSELAQKRKRRDSLEENEYEWHQKPETPNSILETLVISIERLRQESEAAFRILNVISYLDNRNISDEMIIAACTCSGDSEIEKLNEQELDRAMARLEEFSFVSVHSNQNESRNYEMHKLVQDAARYGLSMRMLSEKGEKEVCTDEISLEQDEAYFSSIALKIITSLFPESGDILVHDEKYLTHVMQAAEWAEICGREGEMSSLLARVSCFFDGRGRWREKELVDKMVLKLRQLNLGEKHPDTLCVMESLAETYKRQGRYDEATEIGIKLLELRQESLGERHPDTLRVMGLLTSMYRKQRRYSEAERMGSRVLGLQKEIFEIEHPDTISAMVSFAYIYYKKGQYREAERIGRKVLDLGQKILGEKHPHTLCAMGRLAATHYQQGQYNEAEKIESKTLLLRRETLGEEHPDTLAAMHNLAITWHECGKRRDALKLMHQCFQRRRGTLGPEDPFTVRCAETIKSWEPPKSAWRRVMNKILEFMKDSKCNF